MRCICCKDHVHIVLGDSELSSLLPSQFGWPLFSQNDVLAIKTGLLTSKETTTEEQPDIKEFFGRVLLRAKVIDRGSNGRFRTYLPKHTEHVAREHLPSIWFDFTKGKSKSCNLIFWTILSSSLGALHDCSLINYKNTPVRGLFRKEVPSWSGEFSISEDAEVIE